MLKKILVAVAVAGTLGVVAAPSFAEASLCYDVYTDVNGTVVAQAGCLPA
jgi:hypothetical protein